MSFDLPKNEIPAQVFLLSRQTAENNEGWTERVPIELKEFRLEGFPGQELELRLEAEGYWGTPHRLITEPGKHSLVMAMYQAGRIRAELVTPASEELPENLAMTLQSSTKALEAPGARPIPTSRQICPLTEGRLDCHLPSGRLDVRLTAKGYDPIYLRDVEVRPGQVTDGGKHTLRPVGPVLSRLATPDGP